MNLFPNCSNSRPVNRNNMHILYIFLQDFTFTFEGHLGELGVLQYAILACLLIYLPDISSYLPKIVAYLACVICFSINMAKMRVT